MDDNNDWSYGGMLDQALLWAREYETKQPKEHKCDHKWKATKLIYSTVFDCETCGIKQEDDK